PGRNRRRSHGHVPSRAQRVERVGDQVVEHLLQVAFAHPGQHRRARPPPSLSAHGGLPPAVPPGPAPFAGLEHDAAVVGHRVSRPASGLLTHRARLKASRAAPIMASTAIVPRMTQSLTMSLSSELVDLVRITVPTSPYLPPRKTGMAAAIRDPAASVTGSTGRPAFFAS